MFGPLEILTIIFIALKLLGAISWNWWWVCSPAIFSFVYSFLIGMMVAANGISQGKTMDEIRENIMKSLMGKK